MPNVNGVFRDTIYLTGYDQGRSVPYARTQVLPHRFDNLKNKK